MGHPVRQCQQPCLAPSHSSSILALAWGGLQGLGGTGSIMWQPLLGRIQLKMDVPNRKIQQSPRDGCAWPHGQSSARGYSNVHQPPFQRWGKWGQPCLRWHQAPSLLLRSPSSSHPNSASPVCVELNVSVSSWAGHPRQMVEVGNSQGGPAGPGSTRPRWEGKWRA